MFFACAVPELFLLSCVLLVSDPLGACAVWFDFDFVVGFDFGLVP